ncbi:DNA-binding protein WhiA [Mycoplasmopsis synoviae]|uniref:DNA-binding protein WhiA n=1 Tax=Mycoplasmopsis synoviae TaxID=2109 RepID=UPI001CE0CB82|nr:DNA-binding protein WhiA [Mycoplasmopsis synoviae]UBX99144.1 DNA-binding protein WhiA [Mycoplasmopsis synoviae]UBY00085.1 DNA-binding protein WhiA [Mycoplasmopsis synoviae]
MRKKASFSFEIKKEISNQVKKKKEITTFINGVIYSNSILKNNFYILNFKNKQALDIILKLLSKAQIKYEFENNLIKISTKDLELNFDSYYENYLTFFFSGIFFGSGSLNLSVGSFHLEFSSRYYEILMQIQKKLNEYDFNFKLLKRNQKYTLYIKKQEQILDFLAAINAKEAWSLVQQQKIDKDMNNASNRINNLDFKNEKKVTKASSELIKKINFILNKKLNYFFNEKEMLFLQEKLQNKNASLARMCEIMQEKHNLEITKSGLNHYVRKVNKIYKENKKTRL